MYLRIKSSIRNTINIRPIYKMFPKINDMIVAIQKLKQIVHENNLRKNFVLNDLVKDLFTNKYSI